MIAAERAQLVAGTVPWWLVLSVLMVVGLVVGWCLQLSNTR